jgi:hypothetical protein
VGFGVVLATVDAVEVRKKYLAALKELLVPSPSDIEPPEWSACPRIDPASFPSSVTSSILVAQLKSSQSKLRASSISCIILKHSFPKGVSEDNIGKQL